MKKILIVEDEMIVRSIYRRKFEISGYQVETAEEGEAALTLLPTFKPDAIQVDIMLPGMDGVQVIKRIRALDDFKNVPILVISSFYRPDLAQDAWKAGATKCVSKMDCTPNLALELVEQMLSGACDASPFAKLSMESLPTAAIRLMPAESPWEEATQIFTRKPKPAAGGHSLPVNAAPEVKAQPKAPTTLPKFAREQLGLDKPREKKPQQEPVPAPQSLTQAFSKTEPDGTVRYAKPDPSGRKATTRPSFSNPETPFVTAAADGQAHTTLSNASPVWFEKDPETSDPGPTDNASFRVELWREFIKRAPQIQCDLRERVAALLKSKSISDQITLLISLEVSVASLASLSGIAGFSRISHLAGAMDALIKALNKKPAHMTNSVLRTVAHASDCLNALFRDLEHAPRDIPQSSLILVVDDEPIARRTISVALGKANLRCVSLEDSKVAFNVLKENPVDLVFMDAEMPGLTGFELCGELRKSGPNKTTPVIFVTSLTKFEARAQSSLAGGNDLIAKPFLMMELAVKALTYLLKPHSLVEAEAD